MDNNGKNSDVDLSDFLNKNRGSTPAKTGTPEISVFKSAEKEKKMKIAVIAILVLAAVIWGYYIYHQMSGGANNLDATGQFIP